MFDTVPLTCIPIGTRVKIEAIKTGFKNRERLIELGFTHNTEVIPLHTGPGGDPTAYFVKGTVMALRSEDADNIFIRTGEEC